MRTGWPDKPGHDEKKVNPLFANLPTTIFTVMSGLAAEHGAINLGQGFPDNEGPEDVRRAAAEAVMAGPNQYPPMQGLPALREAVAEHYRRFQGLELDWRSQVLVTSGATEALAAAIMALLAPGDEAVLLEPAYDSYAPQARAVGGVRASSGWSRRTGGSRVRRWKRRRLQARRSSFSTTL